MEISRICPNLIRLVSRWSGVFTCRAENPAGSSVGHYQLSVRGTDLEVYSLHELDIEADLL